MKKYNKFAKYKKILLVDCENVGFSLEIIPEDTYAFMFVSQSNKLYHFVPKNMEIVDISEYKKGLVKKANYMDFYIMYFLMKKIKKWKNKDIVIISKDKDFEGVRNILLQENLVIKCFKGTLNQYLYGKTLIVDEKSSEDNSIQNDAYKRIVNTVVPKWCFDKMTSVTKNLVPRYKTMQDLRLHLSKKQKNIFIYTFTFVPICQYKVDIIYDIYTRIYTVRNDGHFQYTTESLEDAMNVYQNHIDTLKAMSKKYKDNTIFKKAKQHSMLPYIEISSSSSKPLYDCMCEFMNEDEAYEKYFRFIEDVSVC